MTDAAAPHPNPLFIGVSRWRAAGIHLSLSATIGIAALALMLLAWYPGEYFRIAGGSVLVLIMVGVDVGLGPLITLIIFEPAKRGLKFDLAFIATVQLVALGYGSYVMFEARPVYTVFVVDQFITVTAIELTDANLARAKLPQFRRRPLTGPLLVAAPVPADPRLRQELIFMALGGSDLQNLPEYWVPYAEARAAVLKRGQTLAASRQAFPANGPLFDRTVLRLGRPAGSLRVIGVRAAHGQALMLIDAATGDALEMIDGAW